MNPQLTNDLLKQFEAIRQHDETYSVGVQQGTQSFDEQRTRTIHENYKAWLVQWMTSDDERPEVTRCAKLATKFTFFDIDNLVESFRQMERGEVVSLDSIAAELEE